MIVSAIAAVAENRVIGKDNQLIWSLPDDMRFFKTTTSGHCIITGRKNYESMGRPLPNRTNMVVTRQQGYKALGCEVFHSIPDAIRSCETDHNEEEAFIIGGGQIYEASLPLLDKLYITWVRAHIEGDCYFPEIDLSQWKQVSSEHHPVDERHAYAFDICVYERN